MKVADDNEHNLLQNIFAYFNAFSDCNILQSMSCKHDFLDLNEKERKSLYFDSYKPIKCRHWMLLTHSVWNNRFMNEKSD